MTYQVGHEAHPDSGRPKGVRDSQPVVPFRTQRQIVRELARRAKSGDHAAQDILATIMVMQGSATSG